MERIVEYIVVLKLIYFSWWLRRFVRSNSKHFLVLLETVHSPLRAQFSFFSVNFSIYYCVNKWERRETYLSHESTQNCCRVRLNLINMIEWALTIIIENDVTMFLAISNYLLQNFKNDTMVKLSRLCCCTLTFQILHFEMLTF